MSTYAIAIYGMYFLIAFGAAMALVLALGFSMHGERLWPTMFVPAIVPLIALGIALGTLLSGRNLVFAGKYIEYMSGNPGGGVWILRLITLTIVSIATAKLIGMFVRRRSLPAAPGSPLFVALLTYIVASVYLPSAFGTIPTFIHSMFYPLLIFAAAWAARREPLADIISLAKVALYILMIGSLLAALVVPSVAVEPNYQGLIPGLKIRLWGLGSNANSIGPLALLTLLLEYMQPTARRWLRVLLILVTGMVFVLAQSKTVWIALLIIMTILSWYRWAVGRRQQAGMIITMSSLGIAAASGLALMFVDIPAVWDRFAGSKLGDSMTTLSGRTGIWEVAIREWQHSPIFGYGPEIWGPRFRMEVGMPYAFSAHNQFLQTLSVAGTLGFLALLAYLRYVIPAALRAATLTRGVSVALLGMILFRCISETPLSMTGLIDGDALTHFLFFVIILRAPAFVRVTHGARSAFASQGL